MTTHIKKNECKKPRKLFRKEGSLWVCSCGEAWRLSRSFNRGNRKEWKEWTLSEKIRFNTGVHQDFLTNETTSILHIVHFADKLNERVHNLEHPTSKGKK